MNAANEVQVTIEEAEKQIARGEALERLWTNPDFALLIGDVYFKEEPARLASLLGDIAGSYRWNPVAGQFSIPPKEFVQMQESVEKDMHAVGALQSFFRVVAWRANMAAQALDDLSNPPVLDEGEADDVTSED